MNVSFCDLCNESIPLADLELGRAVRRNERLICAACEAAMSGATAHLAPAPPAAVVTAGSSVSAVALALASVALVVGVGGGAYFFFRLEDQAAGFAQELANAARAAPEPARTVSAALVEETNARESELAAVRSELSVLRVRLGELEQAGEGGAALERRVERLDGRMERLDDLASRVEHQSGVLETLTAAVAELSLARARAGEGAGAEPQVAAPERKAAPTPLAPSNGEAHWSKWVAELASADSGTRWQAVQALGDSGDPAVVAHIVPMLADADIFVRMAACRHLGDLGSMAAVPALIDALEDEEASVREAALVSLRGLSGQSIPFDPLARDGDRSKRVKAWRDWWEQASKELLTPSKPKSKS